MKQLLFIAVTIMLLASCSDTSNYTKVLVKSVHSVDYGTQLILPNIDTMYVVGDTIRFRTFKYEIIKTQR